MASRTKRLVKSVKEKKSGCQCEENIQEIIHKIDQVRSTQDILLEGHAVLGTRINNISLPMIIKNDFMRTLKWLKKLVKK